MSKSEARLIRELKKRCTYRRLAEIYYHENAPEYGVQIYGEELCKVALKVLYPTGINENSDKFKADNKSYIGDFYWWE